MTKTLPPITPKQQAMLKLLYKYRFLNRTQLQTLLAHKDKRRIITWLKDLREKEYIDWQYDSTNFIAKSQPAIYCLSLNGIKHLRSLSEYRTDELRKRYKDSNRTQVFIKRCLLIADYSIVLIAKSDDKVQYTFSLPADYIDPTNPHHYLSELKPHLYFSRRQGSDTMEYLLENFEQTLPRYQLRKRLKDYIGHLASGGWNATKGSAPIALFICANTADLLYVKRRTKKLLEEGWLDEGLHLRVTTLDKVRISGVASKIWEEI